ncbi:helix-turn-helix domain-containing protein [Bacteroides xylanisolvens]|jgi:transcriptional regulator with XRE-family HTH domain|uniref:helix-turn-helix domain-containing protein n=1 Tax=Bacteroides xylanisolvens TaxID=371601 RepID=UPI00321B0401
MIDLKKFREEQNITQSELCTILGIAQPYLSSIENGKRPLNEKKFTLLYKHYGNILLKYKQNKEPALFIDEAETSLHPNITKFFKEKIFNEEQKNSPIPYEFVQAMIDERKRHDEMNAELIRQNGELIDMLQERKKTVARMESAAECADASGSGLEK